MKLNLMTFWGLFTVWEGQSGPGRAAGNHTTVRSEESRYIAHLRLQRSIIITSFHIADNATTAPPPHPDTFYEASARGSMLAGVKKNEE